MDALPPLIVTFLGHASVRVAVPADAADFEARLRCAWEVGRDPWPQVVLPAELFVRHLAEHLPGISQGSSLAQWLDELALADLYLACACVNGVPASIETLESHYLGKLPALLAYLKLPAAVLDDVCQSVRIHLLLGTSEARPQLAEYTGRGALLSWMRVVAVRMALRQGSSFREAPEENLLAALEAMPTLEPDAELELIKRRYRREFSRAVCEALASLSGEQRHHLRLHFVDRLSTTELSALFRVNQSTISRRLKSARQAVYAETKRRLRERLGLSSKEFTSLMAVIESQLELNLHLVLREES